MFSPYETTENLPNRPAVVPIPVAVFLTLLAATLGAGLVLRVGALVPTNVFAPAITNLTSSVHSWCAFFISPALFLGFVTQMERRASTQALLPASLLALTWAVPFIVTVMQIEVSTWLLSLMALDYIAIGVFALYTIQSAGKDRSWGIAVASIAYLLSGIGLFGGWMPAMRWPRDMLMAGSLAIVAQKESNELSRSARWLLVGFGIWTVVHSFTESDVIDALMFFGIPAMAFSFGAATWRAIRHGNGHVWSRRYYILAMITFVQGALLRAFLDGVTEKTIQDTLFAVGTEHLEYFTPALALLGLAHRDEKHPFEGVHKRLAWAGFVLVALGSHVMVWSFLTLGMRGMPRRMVTYLEAFQGLHVVCTFGALLLVMGVALALSTRLRSRVDDGHVSDRNAA